MAVNITGTIIATVVATAAMTYFVRSAAQPPMLEGESVRLTYPKSMRVFMYVAGPLFLAASIGTLGMVLFGDADAKLQRVSWFAVPLSAVLGMVTLVETRVNLAADAEGIRGQTAYRGQRGVKWDELVTVSYSSASNAFKLVDRNGACLRMSRYLQGHEAIVALMAERLPKHVASKAIEKYRNAQKAGY